LPPSGFSCSDQLPDDCDIYSIVEKQSQPVLISTSRQIRQMAFDIKHLAYDGPATSAAGHLAGGCRRSVSMRIYVPDGFAAKPVERSDGLSSKMATNGSLLTVDYTSSTGTDVEWKIFF
jgi:hypothetical protein